MLITSLLSRSSCYVLMFPPYLSVKISLLNSSHYTIPNYPIYEQFKKDIASYIRVKVDSFSRQLDGHPKNPAVIRRPLIECQQPMKVCSHNISTRWVVQARLSFSLIRASASSLLVSSSSFVLINDDWLVVQCRVHTRGWKLQWCMVEVLYDGGILSTNLP